jgi:hypothetical protein
MHYRNIEWRDRVDPEELSAIEAARSKREEQSRRLATAQQAERLVWVREDGALSAHGPSHDGDVSFFCRLCSDV